MKNVDKQSKEELIAQVKAQQKTIEVLMDAMENKAAEGSTSMTLFSENLTLEKVVQRKTERLEKQGKELETALTELKNTQAQLLQSTKLESVGRLAAGIAHEINTPVQFIGTNVEFLQTAQEDIESFIEGIQKLVAADPSSMKVDELQNSITDLLEELDWEYLQEETPLAISQCQDGVHRISAIVLAMKDFSHPSGQEKEALQINTILETTITVAKNEWKYVADMEKHFDDNLPTVMGLKDQLGQAFLNMLVNAAHAIEEKNAQIGSDEKGTISITTCVKDNRIEIHIRDTGVGIAQKIQDKVFDPFFTTKKVGKGTGQGLSISHDVIVEKHGGTLQIESKEGEGTTFIIGLPMKKA